MMISSHSTLFISNNLNIILVNDGNESCRTNQSNTQFQKHKQNPDLGVHWKANMLQHPNYMAAKLINIILSFDQKNYL